MRHCLVFVCLLSMLSASPAEESATTPQRTVFGELAGQVLSTGSRRVRLMDAQGQILWQHKGKNVHDCWMLPNGHVLFADGVVTEINPRTNEVLFQYKPKNTEGGSGRGHV